MFKIFPRLNSILLLDWDDRNKKIKLKKIY